MVMDLMFLRTWSFTSWTDAQLFLPKLGCCREYSYPPALSPPFYDHITLLTQGSHVHLIQIIF